MRPQKRVSNNRDLKINVKHCDWLHGKEIHRGEIYTTIKLISTVLYVYTYADAKLIPKSWIDNNVYYIKYRKGLPWHTCALRLSLVGASSNTFVDSSFFIASMSLNVCPLPRDTMTTRSKLALVVSSIWPSLDENSHSLSLSACGQQ